MDFKKWKTRSVKSQGDCLFDSIRIALASINYTYNIGDLRHAVAKRVLDTKDIEMTHTIEMWIELYKQSWKAKDTSILVEYFQVSDTGACEYARGESFRDSNIVSKKDRLSIYKKMITSSFWGEETSLRTLERALYTKFLIFNLSNELRPIPMQPTSSAEIFPHYAFIVLFLNGNHYQPMSHEGKFVFLEDTLPKDVKEVFKEYI